MSVVVASLYAMSRLMIRLLRPLARSLPVLSPLLALTIFVMPSPARAVASHLDERVATLGETLAVAARGLCAQTVLRSGLDLHSRAQYGRLTPQQAQRMFPVTNGVAILLVVPGSTADRAGIRDGDGLLAIDGHVLPSTAPGRRPDYAPTRQALDLLDAALSKGAAHLILRGMDGRDREVLLGGTLGCPTRFQVELGGGIDAQADGTYVKIGQSMVEATSDDAVLSASLAHELAHNMFVHRERQNAAGMRRGIARMFGRNAALSRASESEADSLVPWLLAMAGHDPQAALRWLDLLEQRTGPPAPTHPSWARRRHIITDQLSLISRQRAEGATLRPPFDTINPGPLVPDND